MIAKNILVNYIADFPKYNLYDWGFVISIIDCLSIIMGRETQGNLIFLTKNAIMIMV